MNEKKIEKVNQHVREDKQTDKDEGGMKDEEKKTLKQLVRKMIVGRVKMRKGRRKRGEASTQEEG